MNIWTTWKVKSFTCGALQDLVQLVQFKKRFEKRQWMSVTFSKVAGFHVTLFHGCFLRFLNCTNGNKSRNASQFGRDLPKKISQKAKTIREI